MACLTYNCMDCQYYEFTNKLLDEEQAKCPKCGKRMRRYFDEPREYREEK